MPITPLIINLKWVKKVQKVAKLETVQATYEFFQRHHYAFDEAQWVHIRSALDALLLEERAVYEVVDQNNSAVEHPSDNAVGTV